MKEAESTKAIVGATVNPGVRMTLTFVRLPVEKEQRTADHRESEFWEKNSEQRRVYARSLVHSLIREGKLIRGACCICGKNNAQAHHDNYERPYEIAWLCRAHHSQRHSEIWDAMPLKEIRVLAPLPNGDAASRQTKKNHERRVKGLCVKCGTPAFEGKSMCALHLVKNRDYTRRYNAKRLGRQIVRVNKCAAARAEHFLGEHNCDEPEYWLASSLERT